MSIPLHMTLAGAMVFGAAPVEGVIVAPPVVEGEVGDENVQRLQESIRDAVDQVSAVEIADGPPCDDGDCATALAAESGATHVLTWSVRSEGRDFDATLNLRSAGTGEVIATSERSCEICGVREVSDMLAEQAAALGRRAQGALPATVSITTEPKGAKVWVDGQLVGVTPYEDELGVGEHQIEVGKDGYLPRSRDLDLVNGVVERIHLDLQKDPGSKASPMLIGGAVATAAGVGFIATGATFVALHHEPVKTRCAGGDIDPAGICRFRYNGLPSGIPLLVLGVAGVATGIALIVLDRKKRGSSNRAHVRPTPTGLAVRF